MVALRIDSRRHAVLSHDIDHIGSDLSAAISTDRISLIALGMSVSGERIHE
jgi:hypothetical protein